MLKEEKEYSKTAIFGFSMNTLVSRGLGKIGREIELTPVFIHCQC
jgi:hypothetical protein